MNTFYVGYWMYNILGLQDLCLLGRFVEILVIGLSMNIPQCTRYSRSMQNGVFTENPASELKHIPLKQTNYELLESIPSLMSLTSKIPSKFHTTKYE